jgi:hypothetical protein
MSKQYGDFMIGINHIVLARTKEKARLEERALTKTKR